MRDADLADAVYRIREYALRQAMAPIKRLQPSKEVVGDLKPEFRTSYVDGHRHARQQLCEEIEQMIAREGRRAGGWGVLITGWHDSYARWLPSAIAEGHTEINDISFSAVPDSRAR